MARIDARSMLLMAAAIFPVEQCPMQEKVMNAVGKAAIVTVFAFTTFTFVTGSPVWAGPIVPPGHYCMTWDIGGSDCSFTSYEQCLATASGLDAQCYGKTARVDEASRVPTGDPFNSRAQIRNSRVQIR